MFDAAAISNIVRNSSGVLSFLDFLSTRSFIVLFATFSHHGSIWWQCRPHYSSRNAIVTSMTISQKIISNWDALSVLSLPDCNSDPISFLGFLFAYGLEGWLYADQSWIGRWAYCQEQGRRRAPRPENKSRPSTEIRCRVMKRKTVVLKVNGVYSK